jgi:hypothetical protein
MLAAGFTGWRDELGAAWEEDGVLWGMAWARCVEPVLVRDEATGEALPEVIIVWRSRPEAGESARI